LKIEERKKGLALGAELLEKGLRKHGLSQSLAKSKEILEIVKPYRIKNHEDLLVAIGYGRISVHKLINKLKPGTDTEQEEKKPVVKESGRAEESRGISIKGVDNIMFHRAKCCYPLPGESVAGFVTRGRGISIHAVDCSTLDTHAIDSDRLVEVEWTGDGDSTYSVKVQVVTVDKKGLLAELSAVLSTNNININHLDASTTHDRQALFNFILEIRDKKQLDAIMQKMSQINGVIDVKRVQS
jgi:GTP pyrophosphokinase